MKRKFKKITTTICAIASVALFSTVVSAEKKTVNGSVGYYSDNGYDYCNYNSISTDNLMGMVQGQTFVGTQDQKTKIPAYWAGAQSIVYNSSGSIVTQTPMGYIYEDDIGFYAFTPIYYQFDEGFYTQGLTQAYNPTNNGAPYYPYNQYGTFATPTLST